VKVLLVVCVAIGLLTGCGGSQPMAGTVSAADHQSATPARAQSFHGYFQAKFTDDAGYPIPFASLCLEFTSLGAWHSVPPTWFTGTFLTFGNELFASALAPWSPTAYASLQGSVNARQGSGFYVITQPSGEIYSGGTFTMKREVNNHCS
jgi:hypothetical protein